MGCRTESPSIVAVRPTGLWTCGGAPSIRLRPQVHKPHRFDARPLNVVEPADALRLAFEVGIELPEASFPVAHVGFELLSPPFVIAEVHGDLPELPPVSLDLLHHPTTLPLQRLVQELRFTFAALAQALGCGEGGFLRPWFEMTQQLVDIARRGVEQSALDDLVGRRTATAQ